MQCRDSLGPKADHRSDEFQMGQCYGGYIYIDIAWPQQHMLRCAKSHIYIYPYRIHIYPYLESLIGQVTSLDQSQD